MSHRSHRVVDPEEKGDELMSRLHEEDSPEGVDFLVGEHGRAPATQEAKNGIMLTTGLPIGVTGRGFGSNRDLDRSGTLRLSQPEIRRPARRP
jgi:hypothetical protein